MKIRLMHAIVLACFCAITLAAQKGKVPETERGYHVIAVVPLQTEEKTGVVKPAHSDGKSFVILAYSKDRKYVLVDFSARTHEAHKDLRDDVASHGDPKMICVEKAALRPEELKAVLTAAGFPDVDFNRNFVKGK